MAKLSAQWWTSVKPRKLTNDPLWSALGQYERLVRGKVPRHEVLEALQHIRMGTDAVKPHIKTLLKLDPVGYKKISKELRELDVLADREMDRVAKQSDKLIKVWGRDLGREIDRLVRPYGGSMGKATVTLHLYEHQIEIFEAAHVESQLFQALNAAFDDAVTECKRALARHLREYDYQSPDFVQSLMDDYMAIAERLEEKIGGIPEATLKKATKNAQIAKAYKQDKAVKLTVSSLSFGGSIAGIFAPGTQAVAIVAAVRSATALTKEIVNVARTLEQHIRALKRQIAILVRSYKTAAQQTSALRAQRDAKEAAKILGNALLGTDVFVTVTKCRDDLGEVEGKLSVLSAKLPKLEKAVLEAIKLSGELERKLTEVALKKQTALDKKLKQLAKKLDKTLNEASDTMARVTDAEKEFAKLDASLVQFQSIEKDMKNVDKAIKLIVNLAFSAGGTADSLLASTAALNVAANSISIVAAVEGEVVDAFG